MYFPVGKVMGQKTPPLLVIIGETASGKSALGLQLAQKFNGEIICADSWTVRREVNIGTAKPSAEEQALVSHHLLDVVGPCEDFTAAVFKELAIKAIDDIAGRGKVPIIVGGTGLYVDGVIFDYGFLEQGDRDARKTYDSMSNEQLIELIQNEGINLGDVDTRNKRRLIRLLETKGAVPTRQELRKNTLIVGLRTDREVLKDRIEKRVDAMFNAGLEREVQELAQRYGWDCEALKGVGYAQWRDYFSGSQNLAETRQKILKATQDLAKRQRTWFKRNKSIHWVDTPVDFDEIAEYTAAFLSKTD
jgi:tRNA dimethylallyltransferase